MNEDRIEQLETAMIVAGGRAAATQNRLDDEQAGAYQIEGRLLEATEMQETLTGLQARIDELTLMIDPEILAAHDKETADG